jgi:hypothetical protein
MIRVRRGGSAVRLWGAATLGMAKCVSVSVGALAR